jgi:hypothetical protein
MFGIRAFATALLAATLRGCAMGVPAPKNTAAGALEARNAWAKILREQVDDQGRVDFAALEVEPGGLDTWIAFVAAVSPETDPDRFPTANDQLAYYIDAYNGLAMYVVLHFGVLPAQRIRFFLLRQYTIGGERMSLYTLENRIIRPYRRYATAFALG